MLRRRKEGKKQVNKTSLFMRCEGRVSAIWDLGLILRPPEEEVFTRLLLFTAVAILIPACFHFKCNGPHSDGLTVMVWERPESAALKRSEAVIEKAATPRAIRLDLQPGVRPGLFLPSDVCGIPAEPV